MDREYAEALRIEWKKNGNQPCTHTALTLITTDGGFLTGDYGCTACGVMFHVFVLTGHALAS